MYPKTQLMFIFCKETSKPSENYMATTPDKVCVI